MCEVHGVDNCKAPCCQIHPIGCVCVECEDKAMREDAARQLKEMCVNPNQTLTLTLDEARLLYGVLWEADVTSKHVRPEQSEKTLSMLKRITYFTWTDGWKYVPMEIDE